MYTTSAVLATLFLGAAFVRADPTPNTPAPGDVYNEGAQCTVAWAPDTTGTWTVMNIELMTGNNEAMQFLEVVATVDGTDASKTSFSYPCPDVDVNSEIYFYQFTSPFSLNVYWTGRFTIAGADGATTPPAQTEVSNGQTIYWGSGSIVGQTPGTAPAYGESTAGASSTLTGSATASAGATSSSAPASASASASSASASASVSSSASASDSGALSTSASATDTLSSSAASTASTVRTTSARLTRTVTPVSTGGAATDSAAVSPTSTNAAAGALSADGLVLRAGSALLVAALTFVVAL